MPQRCFSISFLVLIHLLSQPLLRKAWRTVINSFLTLSLCFHHSNFIWVSSQVPQTACTEKWWLSHHISICPLHQGWLLLLMPVQLSIMAIPWTAWNRNPLGTAVYHSGSANAIKSVFRKRKLWCRQILNYFTGTNFQSFILLLHSL